MTLAERIVHSCCLQDPIDATGLRCLMPCALVLHAVFFDYLGLHMLKYHHCNPNGQG